MLGSQVLEVGIGLALLYAFMSLIATALNEAIETVLKARAMHLEQGIRNILDDPDGDNLAKQFFNNPLISILFPGDYDSTRLSGATGGASARDRAIGIMARWNLPSYIPSANFALAVLSIAADSTPKDAAQVRAQIDTTLASSPQLKAVVLQALASGQDDLVKAQKFLENWFDASMDRVSGWYKRRCQIILFLIGIFAAIVLNVDTVTVAKSLMTDPSLRQSVVSQAGHVQSVDFAAARDALDKIGYPIGWSKIPQFRLAGESRCGPFDCPRTWLQIGLGWLITALAITLGAPFWFDLLGKFMQVRAAGNPPDTSNNPQIAAAGAPPAAPAPAPSGAG